MPGHDERGRKEKCELCWAVALFLTQTSDDVPEKVATHVKHLCRSMTANMSYKMPTKTAVSSFKKFTYGPSAIILCHYGARSRRAS